MKIEAFEVIGLFGSAKTISAILQPDLNIFTGPNGAGKTTLLKLLWYIISGNIRIAIREIVFSKVSLITDNYSFILTKLGPNDCKIEHDSIHGSMIFENEFDESENLVIDAVTAADDYIQDFGKSIFLPTFRRIEGGFTLGVKRSHLTPNMLSSRGGGIRNDVEDGLLALSRRLSNQSNTFVASISTSDVVNLLLQRYAELSQQSQDAQRQISIEAVDEIKLFKRDRSGSADNLMDDILAKIEKMDQDRAEIMRPFTAMNEIAMLLFKHRGIRISERISIGETAGAINSDSLSAGEKQMLSFISYNAFSSGLVIFIDEPELSLHVDW